MNWKLAKRVLEIRYPNGYLYFDKSGAIVKDLCTQFASLSLEPSISGMSVILDNQNDLQFKYNHQVANVVGDTLYTKHDKFLNAIKIFFPLIFKAFEIENLLRVGNRIMFNKEMKTIEDAQAYIRDVSISCNLGANLFETSKETFFKNKNLNEVYLKFEDDKFGLRKYTEAS